MPPGVAAERVAFARKAFNAVMADPVFLADIKKSKVDISPIKGEVIQKIISDVVNAPKDIVAKARKAAGKDK